MKKEKILDKMIRLKEKEEKLKRKKEKLRLQLQQLVQEGKYEEYFPDNNADKTANYVGERSSGKRQKNRQEQQEQQKHEKQQPYGSIQYQK